MQALPITVENTSYDAERVILMAVQAGVEYALAHGIDRVHVETAALRAADFLREFAAVPEPPAAAPELKVVYGPETQLRLPFDRRSKRR